jgi:GTP-binding protein
MKIEFMKSVADEGGFPRHIIPEIAFAGRSNVGKSSMLNCLARMKSLARISKKPGCTRTLNFYSVDGRACLVDLPGYGFAKVSKEERAGWAGLIDDYLEERDNLAGVVVVMDSTIPPSPLDLEMIRFATSLDLPVLPVVTRFDKIPASKRAPALAALGKSLPAGFKAVPFSSENGEGRDVVLAWIASSCGISRFK